MLATLSRGDGRASQSIGLKPLDADLWAVGSARSRDRGSVTRHQTYYTFVGAGRFDGLFVLLFSTCTAKPIVVVVYAVCELRGAVAASC